MTSIEKSRLQILARLTVQAHEQKLGRTQVMKLCYFLQEIKGVDLGYDFRLFTYGPYDSEVLSDLATAYSQDILNEQTIFYARGYGYKITPTDQALQLSQSLVQTASDTANKVDEIVREFASFSASELELQSTVVFVDREYHRDGQLPSIETISKRVHAVKPHFSEETIRTRIESMKEKGYMMSLPV
jgi:uncharacterized protein YwgA